MNRKLLILTDQIIRPLYAVRLRSFIDRLTANGWIVEVFAEKGDDICFEHQYPIVEIEFYKSRIDKAIKQAATLIFDWKNRYFSRKVLQLTDTKDYSLVLATTFSTFPLRAAADVAQRMNIPFVADVRDLDEQVDGIGQHYSKYSKCLLPMINFYRFINRKRRNKQLKKASLVTTVSGWHKDLLKHINPNTELIYNGFDASLFYPKKVKTDEFKIVYTGRVYGNNTQDPTLLFLAQQKLPFAVVDWITDEDSFKHVKTLAAKFGVEKMQRYCGTHPHEQMPEYLAKASVVLVLTNDKAHGVLTTKFFEAYAMQKPILCVRSDEGELEQIIKETNAGAAARTADEVISFIQQKYNEWQAEGYTMQPCVNKDFSRQQQAEKLEQLLLILTNEN